MRISLAMWMVSLIMAFGMADNCQAQVMVERKSDYMDGKLSVTSSEKIFTDCRMRMCYYVPNNGGEKKFGIELDLTDGTPSNFSHSHSPRASLS